MEEYRPRLADMILADELEAFGAVLIVGPKWCGKTTTAMRKANSVLKMQDPDRLESNMNLARFKTSELLKGAVPRLIDEWQVAPRLWDAVRLTVDERGEPGQFILTGSTPVDRSSVMHSGTGRIDKMKMSTMTLFESGDSSGEVSLEYLFSCRSVSGHSEKTLEEVASLLVRGGWPQTIGRKPSVSYKLIRGYCNSIVEDTVLEIEGRRFDPARMRGILRSLSRNISSPLSKQGIINDMGSDGVSISINTLDVYLDALRSIFVLEEMTSWNPNLRSKTAIRTTPVIHLCDPAIAAFFLSSSADDLMHDLNTYRLLFESLVVRDLRVYASCIDGSVMHYRDKTGLEADAIIHLGTGKWGAIEIKLGESWVDEAAVNLLKFKERVDVDRMGEPSFLAVVIPTGYAYTRDDGVHVIPITCMRNRSL